MEYGSSNEMFILNPNSPLLPTIILECRASLVVWHFGFHKTQSRLRNSFVWSNICHNVKELLHHCEVCQRFKTDCMRSEGILQPLAIPERI